MDELFGHLVPAQGDFLRYKADQGGPPGPDEVDEQKGVLVLHVEAFHCKMQCRISIAKRCDW